MDQSLPSALEANKISSLKKTTSKLYAADRPASPSDSVVK